ncbi:MAG: hypothetical protein KBC81_01515 [Candidatus Pacebacteria bacterium]|nr:hypothetical protein [Candidatus Paceibacterota bacterium]
MKTLKLSLLVTMLLVGFAMVGGSAHAYFRQAQSYPNYSYNPYQYGYQDNVSQMIQGHLNFVANFTYYPSPVRSCFYLCYPQNYGYGYGNYGWGY